ncbi:SMI1/KNR4 family protein [Lysinibacillus sp. NPDC093190]|uniref:SMI1/KNR4 family protein n=1 Tax=Lysinibacillus sp. NPDC093190 TaxID=3390575 RepID=UPI003D014C8B
MQTWAERWTQLLKQLEQQGARVHPLEIKPVATENELLIVEERLGVRIPFEFRNLLLLCSRQVGMYWSLPDEALLPIELEYTPSGDFGWSLEELEFPDFGGNGENLDEQLYLQFHTAGNGDALLIRIEDGSVWYWSHEEDEFDLLVGSFKIYTERATALGCIGADCGQHRQFCSEDGLDLSLTSSEIWLNWLEQYFTLTLKQAMSNLESLLIYVSMHGVKDRVPEAFAQFDPSTVYYALRNKIEQSLPPANKEAWSEVLAKVCAVKASDWVRTLWSDKNDIPSRVRDYLTANCLPVEEGLSLVLQDIEKKTIDPYTAFHRLRHFHNPKTIAWMKPYVSFPIDGWATLLAESQPSAETLFEWLSGSEVERLIVIRSVWQMMQHEIAPTTCVDKDNWRQLLAFWKENEILRKNKQLFSQALAGLDSW